MPIFAQLKSKKQLKLTRTFLQILYKDQNDSSLRQYFTKF